ncbi:MAG: methenyltetrahydromethanopterin cyclohydrolase [Oscillospiraceae bacterium]|nr:methenyltetrahydromethanopterin cyclohydrolase [Oscillospiraceae bacterium]
MYSLSKKTVELIENEIMPNLWELNCEAHKLESGATIIDMGVNVPGSWEAARLFTLVTLGAQGIVDFGNMQVGDREIPTVNVYLARPHEAALSAQFSAWKVAPCGEYNLPGFASGPARAISYDDGIARMWHYQDSYEKTALAVQTAELPGEELVAEVCEKCHVKPEGVYILAAKTGSLVGCVQVAARSAEVSLWGLGFFGFPLEKVRSFSGYGAIPPVISDELKAMDRVNSSTLYGSVARYVVECDDAEIEAVIPKLACANTKHYGRAFADIYEEAERDIFKMDLDVHKVSVIEITNLRTGKTYKQGKIGTEMLLKSFYENTL